MGSASDICTLDYLIGTLSTAYKGVITSLAARDFCMTETGDAVTLKGTVLSMPAGNYEASLIERGIELARTKLEQGYFELRAKAGRVKQAKNLQIDIIQTGRHIGTFLLKKEAGGEFYLSAVELSGELKGMDLKLLTAPLHDKVGLFRKAEDIITIILSTKKDWPALSEKLNGLSEDFFWASRDGFYHAFPILSRFLFKAAERTEGGRSGKAVGNALGVLELPLEHDKDGTGLRHAVSTWLKEVHSSSIDLSIHLKRATMLLKTIHGRFPELDPASALTRLINSLGNKVSSLPSLSGDLLFLIQQYERGLSTVFQWYGPEGRRELSGRISEAGEALKQDAFGTVFDFLKGLEPEDLDDSKMTAAFHDAALKHLAPDSAEIFAEAWKEVLSLLPALSSRAVDVIREGLPAFIERLASHGRHALAGRLLGTVSSLPSPLREDILLNTVTAAAVLRSHHPDLMGTYNTISTGIIIPAPRVREISTETWAEIANPLHLDRLGKFMDILQLGNDEFRPILVHAIANLFISGVFIPDDRLFQRRISAYLNSPAMGARFILNFLFLQIFPVYYHEVGAVSTIRDYSTEIDAWGNDPVLYFLRKQVHVNASNYNVRLIEKIMKAWVFNDPSIIHDAVPPDVYAAVDRGLFARYSAVAASFFKAQGVLDEKGLHFEKMMDLPESAFLVKKAGEIPGKIMLLCRLYQEVVRKYSFGIREHPEKEPEPAVAELLERMERYAAVFLQREKTEARESLYFKRHIAFGIPSVLGTYHEPKFDALRGFLAEGAQARVFLEKAIASIAAGPISANASDPRSRLRILALASDVLKLHGLKNMQIEEFSAIMEQNSLTLSQRADLLKMWQKELAWTVDFISRTFVSPLAGVLQKTPPEDLPEHLQNLDRSRPDYLHKATDIVIRDMLASVPGLMESDRMIEELRKLFSALREQGMEAAVARAAPRRIDSFDICGLSDRDALRLGPVLGAKAKNLAYLHNRGFDVPCGITLSAIVPPDPGPRASGSLLRETVQAIEARTGRFFGGPYKPLFLSVRSGSYVSMPGILSTILYCGMNSRTLRAFLDETKDRFLAFDSYRRFLEQYSTVVLGLDERILNGIKKDVLSGSSRPDRELSRNLDVETAVERYLQELHRRGMSVPEDVYEQLAAAVSAIYASWFGRSAKQFRAATKTSDDWGTSVTMMEMISGNQAGSGASVFFTRNPFTVAEEIFGETREAATGDDLVFGRHLNRPLSRKQAGLSAEGGRKGKESLEESDPELYLQHKELAGSIERAMGGLPQEVEVTYARQSDGRRKLFVLQTRRMEFVPGRSARFDEICEMESRIIGRGMGGFGGAVSGVASFAQSAEEAARLRQRTGMPIILLRTTANTDDVSLMPEISGIITQAGGVTSHAAVLAHKFEVNAVLGCQGLSIGLDEQSRTFARIGDAVLYEGSEVSIDGSTGLVFSGSCLTVGSGVR